jgi:hypothetical protein
MSIVIFIVVRKLLPLTILCDAFELQRGTTKIESIVKQVFVAQIRGRQVDNVANVSSGNSGIL